MKNTNESGRSMVEMLGVLAIIGVLTVGAMSTVNYGIEAFRVRAAYDLVEETARAMVDLYSWKRSYKDDTPDITKDKICKNVFDDKCIESEAKAATKTAWGKLEVELENDGSGFKMALTDVPYGGCNQLKNMDWVNVSLKTPTCTDGSKATLDFTAY